GFEPPVGEWFRTELRDLFWDVIDTGGRFLPCVHRDAVETLFRQHEARRADRSTEPWAVFGLHWWVGRHRTRIRRTPPGRPRGPAHPHRTGHPGTSPSDRRARRD